MFYDDANPNTLVKSPGVRGYKHLSLTFLCSFSSQCFFKKRWIYFLCLGVLPPCIYELDVQKVTEEDRRRRAITWNWWCYWWLWEDIWVLGIFKHSALNCRTLSLPAPPKQFLTSLAWEPTFSCSNLYHHKLHYLLLNIDTAQGNVTFGPCSSFSIYAFEICSLVIGGLKPLGKMYTNRRIS